MKQLALKFGQLDLTKVIDPIVQYSNYVDEQENTGFKHFLGVGSEDYSANPFIQQGNIKPNEGSKFPCKQSISFAFLYMFSISIHIHHLHLYLMAVFWSLKVTTQLKQEIWNKIISIGKCHIILTSMINHSLCSLGIHQGKYF